MKAKIDGEPRGEQRPALPAAVASLLSKGLVCRASSMAIPERLTGRSVATRGHTQRPARAEKPRR